MSRKFISLWALVLCLAAPACKNRATLDAPPEAPAREPASNAVIKLKDQYRHSDLVSVEKIDRGVFQETIEVLGSVAPEPDEVVQVLAPTPGELKNLLVALGDTVAQGQALARYRENPGGQIKEIAAPRSGVIVGAYAEPGGHVEPAVPLLTIGETARLRCILDIFEKDIGKIHKGQRVQIKSPTYPNRLFEGRITYVSPRVSENSRTVKVRADIDNLEGKLKFGMFVEGRVVVGERAAFVVPETSVLMIEGKPYILVSADGESFSLREVSVASGSTDQKLEILSGLKSGEFLVTRGGFMLLAETDKDYG